MMDALEYARDALAAIPAVASAKVGREANLSPADYPAIRLVPTRIVPGKGYAGRTIETNIFFGMDKAHAEGLENVYQSLSDLEASIIGVLRDLDGRYLETLTDEDQLPGPYKVMVVRAELLEPNRPFVKAAIHATSIPLMLTGTAAPLVPFARLLGVLDDVEWSTNLNAGSITRLEAGATKITLTGFVAGPDLADVEIGLLADDNPLGNRVLVTTAGAGSAVPFTVTATFSSLATAVFSAQALTSDDDSYTFTELQLAAQAV
jgi:hypothetical protein